MSSIASVRVFRILLPANNLTTSHRFYEALLGVPGRPVAEGRVYFDLGGTIVGLLDSSQASEGVSPRTAGVVYFATDDVEEQHLRATQLGALSNELLHDDPASPMGKILVRPWGERSFYAVDPTGNPLCFVDAATLFTGTDAQIEALRRGTGQDSGGVRSRPS